MEQVHFFPHIKKNWVVTFNYMGARKQREIFLPLFFLNLDKELKNSTGENFATI